MDRAVKKQVWERTRRYWGQMGGKMALQVILCVLVYMFFMNTSISEGSDFFISFFYQGMMGTIFMVIGPISFVNTSLPVTMTFGAGRKESLWGMQLANFSMFFLLVFFAVCSGFYYKGNSSEVTTEIAVHVLVIYGIVLLLAMDVGQIGVFVSLRFSRKGTVVYMVGAILVTMGVIVGGVLWAMRQGIGDGMNPGILLQSVRAAETVGLAAAVLLYVAGFLGLRRSLMTYEVGR